MNFLTGVSDPAAPLFRWFFCIGEGEAYYFVVSFLFFHFTIVEAAAIDAWRRSGFQAIAFKAEFNQLFGYTDGSFFCYAATAELFFTNMNDTIQEGTAGDNNSF